MALILVIEDMPDSAELAAKILRNYGHKVFIAENGERGLSLAQEHGPDLIVYDFWLPDIDAGVFLKRLRNIEGLERVPVLACTAAPSVALQPGQEQRGFDGLIQKPYRLSDFMKTIEQHLAK